MRSPARIVLFRVAAAVLLTVVGVGVAEDVDIDAPTASEKAAMDAVWNALNAQPDLVDQHRGFLAYISTHPQLESALEAAGPLERHPVLRDLLTEFDNSLARDEELDRAFREFYAALARDETLRNAADAAYRLQLSEPSLYKAFVDLLGDVDTSLRFLVNPGKPAPVALYAFNAAFKQNSGLRNELLDVLNALHKIPAAHRSVFPWWQKVANERDSVCRPYVALMGQLKDHPHSFWAWHGMQVELARDLKARQWIIYLRRKTRQDPALSQTYDVYLDIVRRRPAYAKAALDKWEFDLGPAPAWPPDTQPPVLPVPVASKKNVVPERPRRPEVKKPAAAMPRMPDMPTRPLKPEKPKVPKPEVAAPSQKNG
jgi:hypothetical protein